jgi:ribose transport system substrate-binding protein
MKIINTLTVIILLFVVAAQAKEYKIGFAQDTLANDWRKTQVDEAVKEVAKYDFLSITIKDANGSMAKQILDIESFIKEDYDYIITSPIEPKITSLVLKKAISKGIKVILIDRGIESDDYTTFIAPDNDKIAQEAAHYLLKKMNYNGTILMLQGIEGATPTVLRENGFEKVAKEYKDIKIIKKRGNYLRNDAIIVLEEIYKNQIKFDAIYSHSDSMLIGARQVMDKYKIKNSIPTVGIDYIKPAQNAILEGKQTASFTYPTCATEGVEAIVKLIHGESVPKNIIIDTQMIDKKNALQIVPIF